MGMHDIEALVERSILFLDQINDVDHRSLFKSLYDFEGAFDTGFTRFRVMDILVKRRFCYCVSLEDHPRYEQFKNELESLRKKDFAHIYRNPALKWHRSDNPQACYWQPPHLYFEAGSEIWKSMADNGRLVGADAIAPVNGDPVDIAFLLLEPALARGNLELVSWWYFVVPLAMEWKATVREAATARNDSALQAIREAVMRSKAYGIRGQLSDYALCDDEWSEASPDRLEFMKWWFPPSVVDAVRLGEAGEDRIDPIP
jgi:hypothetical protein